MRLRYIVRSFRIITFPMRVAPVRLLKLPYQGFRQISAKRVSAHGPPGRTVQLGPRLGLGFYTNGTL